MFVQLMSLFAVHEVVIIKQSILLCVSASRNIFVKKNNVTVEAQLSLKHCCHRSTEETVVENTN